MARPIKRGLNYFPFDIDFFQDEKVVCVAGEFGLKAEITIVKLLCAVYRNGYFLEWSDKEKMTLLHSLPSVSVGLLDQIIDSLLRWGFFCRSLFESANVLTSEGIQRRYFEAAKFRKIDTENLPYLLIENPAIYPKKGVSQGKTPVSQGKTPVSQCDNSQNKIKDNIKLSNTTLTTRKREEILLETFDGFIQEVLYGQHEIWATQVKKKFHIEDMPAAIAKYRDYAIEMSLIEEIQDLKGFKKFFVWRAGEFLKEKSNEIDKNNTGNGRKGIAAKLPPEPECGLIL